MKQLRVRVRWDDFQDAGELILAEWDPMNRRTSAVATQFIMQTIEPQMIAPPAARTRLEAESMQLLMDDLWAMGLRPRGESSAGEAEAMRRHLEDLRGSHRAMLDLTTRLVKLSSQ